MSRETVLMLVFVAVGGLITALAQPLATRKVAPNGIYGFRTPVTLSSKAIWYRVNERAGKQFRVFGLIIILTALIGYLTGIRSGGPLAVLITAGAIAIVLSNQRFADELRDAESGEFPGAN